MIPFRQRNPVPIGAASILVLAVLLAGAFKADSLPLIGGGDTYHAAFAEAGGLSAGDEVRIAGVRVGAVDAVELDGDQVMVDFKVDSGEQFGPESSASIRVKTLLGDRFLAIEPQGGGQLQEDGTIPVERTTSPYDAVDAFSGLAERAEDIDTGQLARSLTTLADLTRNTPQEFRTALKGVSRLSRNIAAKDEQLNSLLVNLRKVSSVLDDRDQDIVALMRDADVLFRALVQRRQSISDLLDSTTQLSRQLTGLVRQSRADLKPALQRLENVTDLLNRNQENIASSLRLMAPFYRVFTNTLGNGPWFDTYIQNIPPTPQLGLSQGTGGG